MATTSNGWENPGIDKVELEKDLYKVWNNWLTESDYHLYIKYGIKDGRSLAKDYVYRLLKQEVLNEKYDWLLPF